jgi:SNF2 family DNA or RNA helicase
LIPDLRNLDPDRDAERWRRADAARVSRDITLPPLQYWNYAPCAAHSAIEPGCQRCGVVFRRHQRVGISWLFLAKRGLLADPVGTGKTIQIAGLLAMLRENGEIPARRALIIARAAAIGQWQGELRRMVPGIQVTTATGTARQRQAKYTDPWDVMIISPETLRLRNITSRAGTTRAGDLEILEHFDIGLVVYDDVDAMRHPESKTAYAVNRLCERADRVVGVHGTPLQKRPTELYSFLAPLGGLAMFGPISLFKHTFVATSTDYYETRDRFGHTVVKQRTKESGIKNGARLKEMIAPMVLRRTPEQIDDVDLPVLQPHTVWLDPLPSQRARYAELQRGVLRSIREDGENVTRAAAMAQFMHGWQICSGLATLDEGQSGDSVKLDWACDRLDGDLAADKVVVFVNFKPNVADLSARLTGLGIGHVVMWGNEASPRERAARLAAFRDDPACRVLIGTTTIEQSLNLQVARHLIAVDTILNPARMTQLAGRIRRDGSAHRTVYFHQLLLRGTQEEAYLALLRREQAVADYVWGEQSEIFEALTPLQLLRLVSGDPGVVAAAG